MTQPSNCLIPLLFSAPSLLCVSLLLCLARSLIKEEERERDERLTTACGRGERQRIMKKVVGRLLQKARSSWRKAHHKDKDHHHHEEDASFQTHHDDEASMDIDDDHDNHLVLTTSQSRVSRVSTTTMEDDDNLEEEDDHDHHHHHHEVPMCLAGHSSGDWSHDSQEPEHRVSLRRCLSSSNALSR